jgi:16S rRNA (cytosine1402-N4)-methyltransferase
MVREVLEVLDPRPGDVAIDCTLGLGGHAAEVMRRIGPTGRLVGLDWDHVSLSRAHAVLSELGVPFAAYSQNFAALPNVLASEKLDGFDLLIADLGMSSVQVDDPDRGFSYVRDGPLDMRMDCSRGRSAAQILETIPEGELAAALRELGDEVHADVIAWAIVASRQRDPITRTLQLSQLVGAAIGQPATRETGWRLRPRAREWKSHPAARTFQTLRMLVNRELPNLQELLRVIPGYMRPGARAAILSFHSGEDRIVKGAFRDGFDGGVYEQIATEPIRASCEERRRNPRARSAKLRWALRGCTAVASRSA